MECLTRNRMEMKGVYNAKRTNNAKNLFTTLKISALRFVSL